MKKAASYIIYNLLLLFIKMVGRIGFEPMTT
jgi:hypothetical protein